MRGEARGYFLKEYGSWSVLIVSYITGLSVSRGFTWLALPLFLALGLLINSKQAFTKWLRKKGDARSGIIFVSQIVIAAVILIAVFGNDIPRLLFLLVFPAAYLLMNRFAGEHFVLTEMLGFSLISLAAVLAKFVVTGGVDVRLFVAVALYFTAGVFKIKSLLLRKTRDRVFTVLYAAFAV
ncbi:MAG TPA: YwiC-like family protein, partial [Nitrospirota bacterium]|nr:YwiC-like family protein [Nitrospirota bacterium]